MMKVSGDSRLMMYTRCAGIAYDLMNEHHRGILLTYYESTEREIVKLCLQERPLVRVLRRCYRAGQLEVYILVANLIKYLILRGHNVMLRLV